MASFIWPSQTWGSQWSGQPFGPPPVTWTPIVWANSFGTPDFVLGSNGSITVNNQSHSDWSNAVSGSLTFNTFPVTIRAKIVPTICGFGFANNASNNLNTAGFEWDQTWAMLGQQGSSVPLTLAWADNYPTGPSNFDAEIAQDQTKYIFFSIASDGTVKFLFGSTLAGATLIHTFSVNATGLTLVPYATYLADSAANPTPLPDFIFEAAWASV